MCLFNSNVSVANDFVPSSELPRPAEQLRGGQPPPGGPLLPVRRAHWATAAEDTPRHLLVNRELFNLRCVGYIYMQLRLTCKYMTYAIAVCDLRVRRLPDRHQGHLAAVQVHTAGRLTEPGMQISLT